MATNATGEITRGAVLFQIALSDNRSRDDCHSSNPNCFGV